MNRNKEHIIELDATVKQLEAEVEDAAGVVDNWQESYQLLETRISELESELATRVQEIQSLQEEKDAAANELDNARNRERDGISGNASGRFIALQQMRNYLFDSGSNVRLSSCFKM